MEIVLNELIEQVPIAEQPPGVQQSKSRRGGARPNSGGARPNSGPKKKVPDQPKPEKWKLIDESDLPEAKRKLLVLPPIPTARNNRPQEMMRWWHSLTEDQLSHLAVYVYRCWPMIRAKQVGPTEQSNLKILTGTCPFGIDTWEADIMREFGSGDYRFSINEDSVHRADIYAKTMRDLERFPPMLDYRMLALDDPSNKEYVSWARMRGLLEGIGLHNEEDQMANAALERMADSNEKLTDRMLDMADRIGHQAPTNTAETEAQLKVIEIMDKGSTRALDTVIGIMDRQAATRENAADPMALVNTIIALTQSLNKNDGKSDEMMKMMLENEREQRKAVQDELREMRQDRRDKADDGESGVLGSLGKLKELKELLVDMGMVKPSSSDEPAALAAAAETAKSGSMSKMLLEMAMQRLPEMIGPGGITGLLSGFAAVIAAAKATPLAPGQVANPSVQPAIAPTLPAPLPPPVISLSGFPQPSMTGTKEIDDIRLAVWSFTPALLHHMNADSLNGYTFARYLIDSNANGRQMYDQMKEAETMQAETIKTVMLQGYPPLWSIIGKTPAKVDKFLGEFMKLDAWEAEQDAADQEDDDAEEGEPASVTGEVVKGGK